MRAALDLPPVVAVELRKVRVTLEGALDLSEHKYVGARQRLGVKLAASDHERVRRVGAQREGGDERGCNAGARSLIITVAGHHDVLSLRERLAKGLPSASPHNDRMPGGQCLEIP